MTGRLSLGDAALVHTLAYRQSSARAGSRGGSTTAGATCPGGGAPAGPPGPRPPRPAGGAPAAHGAPNASALRTPSHFAAGCGAFHRFSPSGGAANGMPLNARTLGWPLAVPATMPESIFTCSGIIALTWVVATTTAAATATKTSRFIESLSKRTSCILNFALQLIY